MENDAAAEEDLLGAVHRQYREESRVFKEQLQRSSEEVKRLREQVEKLKLERDVAQGNEVLAKRALKEMLAGTASVHAS